MIKIDCGGKKYLKGNLYKQCFIDINGYLYDINCYI